jgi:predicted DNA-binding transcriptional regulator AlpA
LTNRVHEAETLNLEQMEAFLGASEAMRFEGETRQQVYPWMERVLCQQQYHQQGRAARGLVRRYLAKMTGLSRAQVTRLIARYGGCGRIEVLPYRRHCFAALYAGRYRTAGPGR